MKLFREDECLRNDPTYPGIRGWWRDKFPGSSFDQDWIAAALTERDYGDHFLRTIVMRGKSYEVTNSVDGFSVVELIPCVIERHPNDDGGCNSCTWRLDIGGGPSLNDLLDGSEVGDKIELEYTEMTEEALKELPEFEGW